MFHWSDGDLLDTEHRPNSPVHNSTEINRIRLEMGLTWCVLIPCITISFYMNLSKLHTTMVSIPLCFMTSLGSANQGHDLAFSKCFAKAPGI